MILISVVLKRYLSLSKHVNSCLIFNFTFTFLLIWERYAVNIVLMNVIEKYFPKEHRERILEEEDTQKAELPLKPGKIALVCHSD